MSITVEMAAPYLGLTHLVSAMAEAVVKANRSADELQNPEEMEAAAALTWESKLRDLAERRAIKGHDWDGLAAKDWSQLNIERDVFNVDDLNDCEELTCAGFQFAVIAKELDGELFFDTFEESANNGAELINWDYWVWRMPKLSAGEAARLMSGLDPDLFQDLSISPNDSNTTAARKRAADIERLAVREGREQGSPFGWLLWTMGQGFHVHGGFSREVNAKKVQEDATNALRELPFKEAAIWDEAEPVANGRRQVTHAFAGHLSTRHFTLPQFVEEVAGRLTRWQEGEYVVIEAVQVLADATPSLEAKSLMEQMEAAIHAGRLVYRKNGIPLDVQEIPRGRLWNRYVLSEDVNDWLASCSAEYRLAYPYANTPAASDGIAYKLLEFERLKSTTDWTGGRMAPNDPILLVEAAKFASKHAGQEVTMNDFLRAGARGEIPIRSVCPRAVTMLPVRSGDTSLRIDAGSYPDLPADACKVLSITGKAHWRTLEYKEMRQEFGGQFCTFTRWRLPDGEPDLVTTLNECLVMGWDVHALADAFLVHTPSTTMGSVPLQTVVPPQGADVSAEPVPKAPASTPVFSMTRAALVKAHKPQWQTIESDLKNASTNGLAVAKAGARDWHEARALEWARANGKLDNATEAGDHLMQVMHKLSSLPGRKNVLRG